ncbi:hypothetical protein A1O3_09781 [Capronia epimyces CBS 606.96]|uniref:3-phytase n=1 Tax=Capronia epimyces CBS 606.96 TaxID=1182542 RepID=W9Y524_9EURO|nr:uncharacterized protein A1O3_09781 [Capronia epimyces CBS 606.96]EXJ77554.1 hypothetical protein A1O3_09781 [Capronia epimyces CBS 606.96]
MPSLRSLSAALLLVGVGAVAAQNLSPTQDINLPDVVGAADPLAWLGASSPWIAGPSIKGISSDVPDGCSVQQAAYLVRHGSRFPDPGSYQGWVTLYNKIQAANFTATGSLAFLKSWEPVLKNTTVQMSQESITGAKEAYDLGYSMRTRYPDLNYVDGQPFLVWANQYSWPISGSRVVNTARNFMRGFMGTLAEQFGSVVSINSTSSPLATGNSLGPSDSCPLFKATKTNKTTEWNNVYLPPIQARLSKLIDGDLNLTSSDISGFPSLCGYESQIVGRLSPWCSVFTDDELKGFEYAQGLSYYYTQGPGSAIPKSMWLPYLKALLSLLDQGPGQVGVDFDGSSFVLPDLLMNFFNDNQIAQMTAAMGIFDDQPPLPSTGIPDYWTYITSRFISMRGTVAFEVLNCEPDAPRPTGPASATATTRTKSATATTTTPVGGASTTLIGAVSTTPTLIEVVSPTPTLVGTAPPTLSDCGEPVTVTRTMGQHWDGDGDGSHSHSKRATSGNSTYIRILLNDAVYPVSCQDGPGNSCLLSSYLDFIADKYNAWGNFNENCNVTAAGTPAVVEGASFYTNLTLPFLTSVTP